MRIPSASTDRYIYFMAVDITDLKTPETGLTGWVVVYSRDGSVDTTYTTPTVTEIDAVTMPGVYGLLLDEGTTLGATHDTEEYVVHITDGSNLMFPVVRTVEIYRPETTEGQTLTVTSGVSSANAIQISGDSGAADNLELFFDGTGYNAANSTVGNVTLVATTTTVTNGVTVTTNNDKTGYALADATSDAVIADAVWNAATATYGGAGSYGLLIETDLDAAISSRSSHSAADVWAVGARTITGGTIDTNNDKTGYALSAAGVDAILDEPLAAHTTADTPGKVLNMLTQDTVTLSTDVALGSIIGQLLDNGTAWSFDRTTDSLEAIRDRGDAAWITAVGFSTHSAADAAGAVWDEAKAGHVAAGSFGEDVQAHSLSTEIAALNDISAAQVNAEVRDVLVVDTLADSYAADGAQPTIGQAVLAIKQFLEERSVSGTTVTIKKPNGVTAAMTFTLDDATNPQSITRTT